MDSCIWAGHIVFTGTKSTLRLSNRLLCLAPANTKSVLFFCRAARVLKCTLEHTFSLSPADFYFIYVESNKQAGVTENQIMLSYPLQCVVPVFLAFGVSKGACRGMLEKPLTIPLPLWKISAFSPRFPEVYMSSSVLFISPD